MWRRLAKILGCPICKNPLELLSFKEASVTVSEEETALSKRLGLFDEEFNQYVESGSLVCHNCKNCFPIMGGLPVLLPYTTPVHKQFVVDFKEEISQLKLNYEFPKQEPVSGERFVMDSFSQEWADYSYDGVLWDESYEDLEQAFLREVNFNGDPDARVRFLEIGCGLGVTTSFAHKNYKADAVGVDLSVASLKAAQHFKGNPFLHFVQASVFYLPFRKEIFDIIYSRGVLLATYSTHEAFKAVVPYCQPGGRVYIWLYGPGSIKESWLRRVAYVAEATTRPILSRRPSSPVTTAFLSMLALGYMAINALYRLRHPETQKYTYKRALHAARDRFTPRYAHRHEPEEVVRWFEEAGFEEIEIPDWRAMPAAEQDTYRRNVGVRGKRKEA